MSIEQDLEQITSKIKEHKVNGNPEPEVSQPGQELSPMEIEAGILAFRRMQDRNTRLKEEIADLKDEVVRKDVQIQEISKMQHIIEDRVSKAIADRDDAVRESSELRGALNSIASILIRYVEQKGT